MSNPTPVNLTRNQPVRLSRRVARVVVVGLSAALSVGLIGAVNAKTEPRAAETPAPAAMKAEAVRPAIVLPSLLASKARAEIRTADAVSAAATERADTVELLHDENEPLPVAPPAPQPVLKVRRMLVTAYCPCRKCCGPNAQGLTASGLPVSHNGGRFVAADTSVLGFGTKLVIPGYADGQAVEVIDRGGAIKGDRLDVYFPSHAEALQWGRQWVDVIVVD
jgi:3D (Asp-Asp-Asp) domain-containing protein